MTAGGVFIEPDDDTMSETGPQGARHKKLSLSSMQKPPSIIYLMTVLSAMGGFLFGYDTGIVGGAMVFVKQVFQLDPAMHELIVGITIFSAWLFSLVAGRACDSYGRKRVILWASVIFTLGSVVMGIATTQHVLVIGRFVVGIAIGLASTAVPIYIAEVAPSNIRGSLVTLNNCFITFGQLAAAVTAGAFSYDKKNGWRWMLALASVPAVIQFVGFIFMPESPRWLLRQERAEEALKALKRIRGEKNPYVLREFDKIRQNTNELRLQEDRRKYQNKNLIMTILRRRATRRALKIGCIIMIAQQLAGINTVMYYTPTIIQMSGIQSDSAAVWLAVPAAAVYVVFSICGCLIADRMNRRMLLLSSLMGVMVSLIILGGGFHLNSKNTAPVTDHNTTTISECYDKSNCATCIEHPRCGFCFSPENPRETSFCLEADPDKPTHSTNGLCKASEENISAKRHVFARRLCPQVNDGISMTTWMVLLGLVLYLAFFAPGMGPMPWTINSEIYPMWARSSCYSIATSINWLTNMIVSFTFISLTEAMSQHMVFYMYAMLAGFFWVILFLELPETRGRSLDDIGQLFAKGSPTKRSSKRDSQNMISGPGNAGHEAARSADQDDDDELAPPAGFDQFAVYTTQVGTGAHRQSYVLCHEDLVLASEQIAKQSASKQEQQQQQQQEQKTQAVAGAAQAAEKLALEADKLANGLAKQTQSLADNLRQQANINGEIAQPADQPKRKYSSLEGKQTKSRDSTKSNEQ